MANFLNQAVTRKVALGELTEKTAAVAASGSSDDLFTVDDGAVIILGLWGIVETALPANTDLDVDFDPDDGGSDVALASTLVADSDVTGTVYTLNTTAGGALVAGTDVGYNGILATPITLADSGDIKLASSGGGAGGGSIHWYCVWLPLEAGAALTAAA